MNTLTPYNWTTVQKVEVEGEEIFVPRRCMHCGNATTYFPGAFLYGYRLVHPAPGTAVVLPASGNATLDFVMEPIARVSVNASTNAAEEGRSDEGFVFTRSGPVEQPLEVWFQLGGTAGPEDFGGELTAGRVTIPSGTNALFVPVTLSVDLAIEEPETLVVNLAPRRQFVRTEFTGGQTNYITVYYPGWDVGLYAGGQSWFQTETPYTYSTHPPAELNILDGLANEFIMNGDRFFRNSIISTSRKVNKSPKIPENRVVGLSAHNPVFGLLLATS